MKLKLYIHILFGLIFCFGAKAQNVAVKTNLLYDAAATINAGVEVGLAPKWTLDVSGNFNGWTMSDDRKWKHWMIQPEARYWFCDRFAGHFLGIHAHGGQFRFPFIGGLVAPDQGFFPEFEEGIHTKNQTTLIISRGLGNSIIPQRLFNRPHLIEITLKADAK